MKKTFIALDIIAILIVIALLISPNILGDKFLNLIGLRLPKRDNQTIALTNINDNLYVDTESHLKCDNDIEEDIINHDSEEPYKLTELTIDDFNAFLVVVYNPANVRLMIGNGFNTPNNTGKMTIQEMVTKSGAVAGINGGGFFDNGVLSTDRPIGCIIKDGTLLWGNPNAVGELIGFNNENKLTLVKTTPQEAIQNGMRDAIEFGPYLMIDGELTEAAIEQAERKVSRVIIAQREDGIVLFLATDGGTLRGPRLSEIMDLLKEYGAVNAANLDGGASTQLVINDEIYTDVTDLYGRPVPAGRRVVNGFGIFAD